MVPFILMQSTEVDLSQQDIRSFLRPAIVEVIDVAQICHYIFLVSNLMPPIQIKFWLRLRLINIRGLPSVVVPGNVCLNTAVLLYHRMAAAEA